MELKNLKKFNLPDKPGIYFFLQGRDILYIGKATSLKDRVKSYFGKDLIGARGPIILDMVFKADKIKWQVTDSVLEALILEAQQIKKYQPKYNSKEKSDKSFNYVAITKEKIPRVVIVREKNIKQAVFKKVFGPYPNSSQLREAVKIIRRIFPFLDDKNKNYLEFYKQINLVPDLKDRKLYLENIKNVKLFFEGKKKIILRNLKKEMMQYAQSREFEKATEVKRQIFALKHINDVALLKNQREYSLPESAFVQSLGPSLRSATPSQKHFPRKFRIEAYDVAHMSGKNMVGVMTVIEDGEVNKSEYKKFKVRTQGEANDVGALREILERRFAHNEWGSPDLVVVDGGVAQLNAACAVLLQTGANIPVVAVTKDDRHRPKDILLPPRPDLKGAQGLAFINKNKSAILLANSEAHRFSIAYHKNLRGKNFLPGNSRRRTF